MQCPNWSLTTLHRHFRRSFSYETFAGISLHFCRRFREIDDLRDFDRRADFRADLDVDSCRCCCADFESCADLENCADFENCAEFENCADFEDNRSFFYADCDENADEEGQKMCRK